MTIQQESVTIHYKAVRKLLQSVSLLLALLLLAPPVVASARCVDCAHEPAMEMACCAGMESMQMDAAAAAPESGAQLAPAACCAATQTELALPAAVSDAHLVQSALALVVVAELVPAKLPMATQARDEFPPGARPLRATLTQLCSFLI